MNYSGEFRAYFNYQFLVVIYTIFKIFGSEEEIIGFAGIV
jgi:hypothetical protein